MTTHSGEAPFTLSKEEENTYVTNWQNNNFSLVPGTITPTENQFQLNSFLFSVDDFTDFAQRVIDYNKTHSVSPITGVICKIGIKPTPYTDGPTSQVPCLIFEPLTGFSSPNFHKDVPVSKVVAGNTLGDLDGLSARYDFSYPCPPTCSK